MNPQLREILGFVAKPARYAGGELGVRTKSWEETKVKICMAFPDAYEIGMSHLGLSILYHIINDNKDMLAERVFAPWLDMEEELKKRNMPLPSIESSHPLSDFDIVGFSLCYELTYTNVLNMLKLANIPLLAKDRLSFTDPRSPIPDPRFSPLIIAGGPCTFNPMPMSDFFDAIVIGDGENVILEIGKEVLAAKENKISRIELLKNLSKIQGVFVPLVAGEGCIPPLKKGGKGGFFTKSIVPDLNSAPFPKNPIVPHFATQQRLGVEVARGCTRGCRFCQAGYISRPLRQRSLEVATDLALSGIKCCGQEELSFLSLSVGDWSPLEDALTGVHEKISPLPVDISLPSLRVETLTEKMMTILGSSRAGSFTLAPEAATERMRSFINKGNTDAELYSSVEKVFANGWHAIKLYFMIGLPGETKDEIDGIVSVSNKCLDIGRKFHHRPEITVSTSTFVPKSNTPFQWERQITIEEASEIQRELKRRLRRPGLYYRWHDAGMSFVEGVLSRGGKEIGAVLEIISEKGARFDAWDEHFNLKNWMDAFEEAGLNPGEYLMERDLEKELPWDFLNLKPSKEFLLDERKNAYEYKFTPDCSTGKCTNCGVCDFKEVKNVKAHLKSPLTPLFQRGAKSPLPPFTKGEIREAPPFEKGGQGGILSYPIFRYRLKYTKEGTAAFLGSIESLDAMRRAIRMSGLPICYSKGYHPRPKMSFGPALSIGYESLCEFTDVELEKEIAPDDIVKFLEGKLPQGFKVLDAVRLSEGTKSIEDGIVSSEYEVDTKELKLDLKELVSRFNDIGVFNYIHTGRKGAMDLNLKDYMPKLAVIGDDVLGVTLKNLKPNIRIDEAICAIVGIEKTLGKKMIVKKISVE